MTAQAHHTIRHAGEDWALVGVNGTVDSAGSSEPVPVSDLFRPEEHGLDPIPTSTGNWRGFLCTFEIREDRLLLARLEIGLGGDATPEVFGRPPAHVEGPRRTYELDAPIAFSGTLTLARDLIQELYEHMGYQEVWKFERVLSLRLSDGHLDEARDESETWARYRATSLGADGRPLPPPPPPPPPRPLS